MKKQFIFTVMFAAGLFTAQAQSLASPGLTPDGAVRKIRQATEQPLGIFNGGDHDHGDFRHWQKQKKSKKCGECNGNGNHYGKHKKNKAKNACCCHDRQNRDCGGDNDRRSDRSSRNGRGSDDRGYGSAQGSRDETYRTQRQPSHRKGAPSTAKVKTRPSTSAKPAPVRPGARQGSTRPAGART